jgi:hypothetical protein
MLVRMSSRPPFTPEPQKRDSQILVPNCIAGEAVVRILSSNSFDRCNYATSASDRRVHGVFNWSPRSNSVLLIRLGLAGWHPPRHPCRPVQQSKVDRASMVVRLSARLRRRSGGASEDPNGPIFIDPSIPRFSPSLKGPQRQPCRSAQVPPLSASTWSISASRSASR